MADKNTRKVGFRPKKTKPTQQSQVRGQLKGKKPTKKTIINEYQAQIQQLQQAMGQILNIAASGDQKIMQEVQIQQKWLEKTAYKLDALFKILSNITMLGLSEEELKTKATEMWVKDFEKGAAEDDKARKLVSLPEGTKIRSGDIMTAQLWVFDEDGRELKDASRIRVRFNVGRAEFSPEFDNQLIGMTAGETKEFELQVPPLSGSAGKKLKFKVHALEVKTFPVKPSTPQQPMPTKEQVNGKKEDK